MRTLRTSIVAAAIVAGLVATPIVTSAAGAATASGATVISTSNSPFGKILVVGSGQYQGYTVYLLSSDNPPSFECTTKVQQLPPGPIACTGAEGSQTEWPAVTTTGMPVAGPGVKQSLLGMTSRSDLGADQVTYAGHPLYLFDQSPFQVTGQGWDEPGLPPWQGLWSLVAPSGRSLPWVGTLTTITIGGKKVLAAPMFTPVGWEDFPLYSYSKDTPWHSTCTGSCAIAWPPMLTSGTPGVSHGLGAESVGTLHTPDGTQVSYDGKPLYLFGSENPILTASGAYAVTGNGNSVAVGGGTFTLVSP